jgi:hypothetical protein
LAAGWACAVLPPGWDRPTTTKRVSGELARGDSPARSLTGIRVRALGNVRCRARGLFLKPSSKHPHDARDGAQLWVAHLPASDLCAPCAQSCVDANSGSTPRIVALFPNSNRRRCADGGWECDRRGGLIGCGSCLRCWALNRNSGLPHGPTPASGDKRDRGAG